MISEGGFDMGRYALDERLPEIDEIGGGQPPAFFQRPENNGLTLRQILEKYDGNPYGAQSVELVGSPRTVAARMGEYMDEIGGDGWLVQNQYVNRRYIAEICDGLEPELQKLGRVRSQYSYEHFRDNLLEF